MGFSSFSFDPLGIAAASTAASSALLLTGANSTAASSALAKAVAASTAASSAIALLTSAIFTDPAADSFAVKNIVYTSAGEVKFRYSTAAAA